MTDQQPEKLFQTYSSVRPATKVITKQGNIIRFLDNKLITENKEFIEYLDSEIAIKGLRGISKGKAVTSAEADPMVGLRKKHIAEYLAAEAAELEAQGTSESDTTKLTPANSQQAASMQALLAKAAAAKAAKTPAQQQVTRPQYSSNVSLSKPGSSE